MKLINLDPSITQDDFHEKVYLSEYDGETENSGEPVPWEVAGYKVFCGPWSEYTPHKEALKAWDITKLIETPINRWVADFYLLDAVAAQIPQGKVVNQSFEAATVFDYIEAGIIPETSSRDDLLSLRAMYLQERLVRKLTPLLEGYLWFAAAGEVVYHYAVTSYLSTSDEDRCRVLWKKLTDKVGKPKVAQWTKAFFLSGNGCGDDWESGYGGIAWADCVEPLILLEKGEIHGHKFTPKNFCDRVFALQHNGGTVLDKTQWLQDPEYLHMILEAHAYSDWDVLAANASPQVRQMFTTASSDKEFEWKPTKYPTFQKKSVPSIADGDREGPDYCCPECNGY